MNYRGFDKGAVDALQKEIMEDFQLKEKASRDLVSLALEASASCNIQEPRAFVKRILQSFPKIGAVE